LKMMRIIIEIDTPAHKESPAGQTGQHSGQAASSLMGSATGPAADGGQALIGEMNTGGSKVNSPGMPPVTLYQAGPASQVKATSAGAAPKLAAL
jgi:hypothetical protein